MLWATFSVRAPLWMIKPLQRLTMLFLLCSSTHKTQLNKHFQKDFLSRGLIFVDLGNGSLQMILN